MDRIRNARHFAPRLQRWLDNLAASAGSGTAQASQATLAESGQLDLFASELLLAGSGPATAAPASPPRSATEPAPVAAPSIWHAPQNVRPGAPAHHAPATLLRPPPAPLRRPEVPLPPPSANAPPRRQLMVGEFVLEYVLRRSARRSIGFMIDDEGLRVTAPARATIADIDNAIRAKQGWILSKLNERRERRAARLEKPPVEWRDGAVLPYLGANITLRLSQSTRNRTDYNPDTRELNLGLVQGATEMLVKERVRAWMQQEAKLLFEQRLDLYAARLGVSYRSFALSSAGTRWGSCTVHRTIRLNWKLLHFSLPLIDYVVAHELAHILEMNHSPRFWAAVGRIYPAYDEAKALLRKRAQELPMLFE